MLPLILVGIFAILLSFFIGSDFGEKALGGSHPTMEFWTFWIGVVCVGLGVALLIFALLFGGFMVGMALRD